jgi:hypothetical protein
MVERTFSRILYWAAFLGGDSHIFRIDDVSPGKLRLARQQLHRGPYPGPDPTSHQHWARFVFPLEVIQMLSNPEWQRWSYGMHDCAPHKHPHGIWPTISRESFVSNHPENIIFTRGWNSAPSLYVVGNRIHAISSILWTQILILPLTHENIDIMHPACRNMIFGAQYCYC